MFPLFYDLLCCIWTVSLVLLGFFPLKVDDTGNRSGALLKSCSREVAQVYCGLGEFPHRTFRLLPYLPFFTFLPSVIC
jgi:hypothetical protein